MIFSNFIQIPLRRRKRGLEEGKKRLGVFCLQVTAAREKGGGGRGTKKDGLRGPVQRARSERTSSRKKRKIKCECRLGRKRPPHQVSTKGNKTP